MYYVAWQYEVAPNKQHEFEKEYSTGGAWHRLFSTSAQYVGLQLTKQVDKETIYVLMDVWESQAAYEHFLTINKTVYQNFSTKLANLYLKEDRLGDFERKNVA